MGDLHKNTLVKTKFEIFRKLNAKCNYGFIYFFQFYHLFVYYFTLYILKLCSVHKLLGLLCLPDEFTPFFFFFFFFFFKIILFFFFFFFFYYITSISVLVIFLVVKSAFSNIIATPAFFLLYLPEVFVFFF